MGKVRTLVLVAGAILVLVNSNGCYPLSMGIGTPVPVPPWVTERLEEKYTYKNDHRTTILPPIKEGFPPPLCEDPPDEGRVLRAMPHITRGVPYFYEEFRDSLQVVVERQVDKIDPVRFFPLIGPAQLHHCHWKCTIYYNETVQSDYPFPIQVKRPRVEVVYIDTDHLHLFPGENKARQQTFEQETHGY
jgi:hypothetical protein